MWNEKNGEKGIRNNFKLVRETIHRKLILTVLAHLHLRPDFKSYICLREKTQCDFSVKIIIIKNK